MGETPLQKFHIPRTMTIHAIRSGSGGQVGLVASKACLITAGGAVDGFPRSFREIVTAHRALGERSFVHLFCRFFPRWFGLGMQHRRGSNINELNDERDALVG